MSKTNGTCDVPRCRRPMALVYLNHNLCDRCWSKYTSEEAGEAGSERLKKLLGIKSKEPK